MGVAPEEDREGSPAATASSTIAATAGGLPTRPPLARIGTLWSGGGGGGTAAPVTGSTRVASATGATGRNRCGDVDVDVAVGRSRQVPPARRPGPAWHRSGQGVTAEGGGIGDGAVGNASTTVGASWVGTDADASIAMVGSSGRAGAAVAGGGVPPVDATASTVSAGGPEVAGSSTRTLGEQSGADQRDGGRTRQALGRLHHRSSELGLPTTDQVASGRAHVEHRGERPRSADTGSSRSTRLASVATVESPVNGT